ncbi:MULTISPECIES: hypothetical protein [Actinomadura]|uniref:Uncharacterized protein n=1 Tax=Actinomadura yumaensis TaxID=111807 RepID=A0ABW2CVC0_9ACTN|nr:hypothetical protein [Actinomadura sp. J1-007]MWK35303.1 hypothetical protein [Actinomadura sp. J1-007]
MDADRARDLGEALAAYERFMDAIVPASQYYRGRREDAEEVRVYGDIIQRAAARQRQREREAGGGTAS